MEKTLKERLFTQIEAELDLCNGDITPLCCYNYTDLTLRQSLVETIAETCISMKIGISEAIVEVERLYSMNSID